MKNNFKKSITPELVTLGLGGMLLVGTISSAYAGEVFTSSAISVVPSVNPSTQRCEV